MVALRRVPIRKRKQIKDLLQHSQSPPAAIQLAFDRLRLEDVQYVVHSQLTRLHILYLSSQEGLCGA